MTTVRGSRISLLTLLCVALALSSFYTSSKCAPTVEPLSPNSPGKLTNDSTTETTQEVKAADTKVPDPKKNEAGDEETSPLKGLPFALFDIFKHLSPRQLELIKKHIDDEDSGGLEAVLMTAMVAGDNKLTPELKQLVVSASNQIPFVKGLLEVAMSRDLVAKQPDPSKESIKPTDSSETNIIDVQKQLDLFDSLQTALYGVPLEELGYIKNAIESGNGIDVMDILLKVKKNFPKLTDDLIHSAASDLMTLQSVVDNLKKNQLTVNTEQKTQPPPKSADGEVPPTEKAKESGKDMKLPSKQVDTPAKDEKHTNEDLVNGPTEKEQDLETPEEKEQDLETPEEKEQDLETPEEKEQDLETPEEKEQDLETPEEKEQDLETPEEKEQDLETPEEKEQDLELPEGNIKNSPDTVSSGGWFGAWHFLIIFLVIAGVVAVGYLCTHNRKKIREGIGSYVADARSHGKRTRNFRYRPVRST